MENVNLLNINLNNKRAVNQTMIVILDISAPKTHVMLKKELVLNATVKRFVLPNMNLFVDVMVKLMVTSVKQPELA
jgi:hypothetical protein